MSCNLTSVPPHCHTLSMERPRRHRKVFNGLATSQPQSKNPRTTTATHSISSDRCQPAAQPHCPLFLLPAELRNEIYLFVAVSDGCGLLKGNQRDRCTSLDSVSLTCKYIRHEYLDVLSKSAHTLVAHTTSPGFCNTLLLRHERADPNQKNALSKRKKARPSKRRAGVNRPT